MGIISVYPNNCSIDTSTIIIKRIKFSINLSHSFVKVTDKHLERGRQEDEEEKLQARKEVTLTLFYQDLLRITVPT